MKSPKKLLSEAITAVLDEFFEVDPDSIESNLLGTDTQIVLRSTRLRPHTAKLLVKHADGETVTSFTTGIVEEALFTWEWVLFGKEYLVKDAKLVVQGLKFATKLVCNAQEETKDDAPNDASANRAPSNRPQRRRSSLAEIKKEGLVENYIRRQVEHIIDALTIQVEDFKFRLELPPNEDGKVSGVLARGNSVDLKSVGGNLGSEDRLRHRASFVNGGLMQQLSFGCVSLDIFKFIDGKEEPTVFPLLEPLSYELLATRLTGERFSDVQSGLKVVGVPVYSSHRDVEEMDIVLHAGTEQLKVLVELGNLVLERASPKESQGTQVSEMMSLTRERLLDVVVEEDSGRGDEVELKANRTVWYSLTEEELQEIERDYGENDDDKNVCEDITRNAMLNWNVELPNEGVYESLKHDVMKSSIFEFPITGVSVILPNGAKLTLESLCVNYRADGTVLTVEGSYGSGILIDGFQLVQTNGGWDDNGGGNKSRWVVNLISSRFTIEEESGSGNLTTSSGRAAHIRWTEAKLDRLIQGWIKLLDSFKRLKLEKKPEYEFGGAISNGFSISFG